MSNHARCRQDAPGGTRSRSSSNLAGPLLASAGGLHSVLEHPGKTYENQRDGARNKDCTREMKRELTRLRSFLRWPSAGQAFRADLASAGFFYVGPEDRVQCFSCEGFLNCRIFRESAMQEHRKYIPHCHFVMGREVGNIPKRQSVGRTPDRRSEVQRKGPETSLFRMAVRPDMAQAWMREHSFRGWPKHKVQPRELARAGFYYTGDHDCVWCFHCNAGISNWKSHHDPWTRHAHHSPRCGFLIQQTEPDFILSVEEQYCESPPSPKVYQQSRGSSTTACQGLVSSPAQPPASSQSLVTGPWLDDPVESLMQAILMEYNEQTTQQKRQSTFMDVKPWDSFSSHVYLPSDREILEFDLDDAPSEGLSSSPAQSPACTASFQSLVTQPWLDDHLASPLMQDIITGHFKQTTQQILQSASFEDLNPWDSVLSICEGELLFDMDDVSVEGTPATVQEKLRQLKEERVCKICRDSEVAIVFVPCGHLVVCTGCAPGLNQCPICRASIEDTVRTFMS